MKKIVFAILSLLVLASCSNKQTESTESTVEKETIEATEAIKLPTVIDFSATWCPPCQQFKPIFEEAKEKYSGQIEFKTIDVDVEKELAQQFNITSIPAIVFIDTEGNEINRIIGFTDKDSFEKAISENFKLNN